MTVNPLPILLVEDDPALREALTVTLELEGETVVAVENGKLAMEQLFQNEFALIISDIRMPAMDGITLLKQVKARSPAMPMVLMTAYGEVQDAVEAMRVGACDYLVKPFEPERLLDYVRRYRLRPIDVPDGVIAADPAMIATLQAAKRVAQTNATVMLTGESGCGKEVIARYVHTQSDRKDGPFIAINCAAIPENLLEATLFGYEKGAFTGAHTATAGKFEQAEDGTILLDEISEMSLPLQAKLLRVLQEREVERVGGKKTIPLNIRVVATSNRNMVEYVSKGSFREDLYYRLNVFPIRIPALRERRGDILPLARFFVQRFGKEIQHIVELGNDAEQTILNYDWPGNVRELENVMQRAVILESTPQIQPSSLQLNANFTANEVPPDEATFAEEVTDFEDFEESVKDSDESADMKELERRHILGTLASVNGSRKLAIEKLGISERTLRYKLKKYREEGYLD